MVNFIYTGIALLSYRVASSSASTVQRNSRPTATIDSGILIGTSVSEPTVSVTVDKFLGIPFAKSPVRWKLPEKPESWQGSRDASRFGNACYQQLSTGKNAELLKEYFNSPPATVPDSEDCLYLNVFAPASAQAGSNRAVMFWIHGGTDSSGTAALPEYDGTNLAGNQDVIVVTTNYRLNLFGFPSSPDIPDKERNLGLHDQRLALDWVQRNIQAFGGDPSRVTIFGQSSGARSVDNLITAPPDPVPFAGAIMQSSEPELSVVDRKKEKATWDLLVQSAGCNSTTDDALDCLRRVPAKSLLTIAEKNGLSFTASPDNGVTFVESMPATRAMSLLSRKAIARVPLLIGSNADEASLFLTGGVTLDDLMAVLLGNKTSKRFLEVFRPKYTGFPSPEKRDEALVTDFIYTCPTSRTTSDSTRVKIPTWRYFYNASFANTELFPGSGAYHSAEIRPIFGFFPENNATAFEIESSKAIQKAWADFAKNPTGGPGWDQARLVQLLGGGATPGEGDENRIALETVNASIVDTHCGLYKSIYDAVQFSGILGGTISSIIDPLLGLLQA